MFFILWLWWIWNPSKAPARFGSRINSYPLQKVIRIRIRGETAVRHPWIRIVFNISLLSRSCTVCPISLDPFYIVTAPICKMGEDILDKQYNINITYTWISLQGKNFGLAYILNLIFTRKKTAKNPYTHNVIITIKTNKLLNFKLTCLLLQL